MQSIKELYRAYRQDVFLYLMSLTHDLPLAEDLVSETFLGAILSLPRFRGECDIKTWLFSIARHKWYEHLRKKKEAVCLDELTGLYFSGRAGPLESTLSREAAARALALLEAQGERTQTVVLMRIQGYSFYEIATHFDISESAARVIDFRAKKKIRETLEKEGLCDE